MLFKLSWGRMKYGGFLREHTCIGLSVPEYISYWVHLLKVSGCSMCVHFQLGSRLPSLLAGESFFFYRSSSFQHLRAFHHFSFGVLSHQSVPFIVSESGWMLIFSLFSIWFLQFQYVWSKKSITPAQGTWSDPSLNEWTLSGFLSIHLSRTHGFPAELQSCALAEFAPHDSV